jgi:membrane protein YdbS with pleckstrin-like domain
MQGHGRGLPGVDPLYYSARVAPKLGPGESVLFEGHPSWRAILDFYLKGFAVTAVVCLLVALGTGTIGDETNSGLVVLLAVAGVGITILVGFIKRIATSYTITNRRLHIKRGIVSRTIQETRLERVQNVNYTQSVVQRVLQIGDVDFDTAAGDDYNFVFAGVAEPADVVHRVDEATRSLGSVGGLGDEDHGRQPPPQA